MSRNRSTPIKPGTVITVIAACAAICLAGIGYVWAKTQVHILGRDLKKLEVQLDELKHTNAALERRYAAMCTPQKLEAAVRKLNLGLATPRPDQIVRLPEPGAMGGPASSETRNYAARGETRR